MTEDQPRPRSDERQKPIGNMRQDSPAVSLLAAVCGSTPFAFDSKNPVELLTPRWY